jgi:hypothetical protein
VKEARSPNLVDAFERGAEPKPGTPLAVTVSSGKPAARQGRTAGSVASPGTPPSAAALEPSARMRCWCSEE